MNFDSPLSLSSGTTTEDEQLPRDEVFEVLSNSRRRCALHYLKQHADRRVELRELVDHVAAWENDTTVDELESTNRKCVYTALRQSHLPKMDDAGVVDYDLRRGEIELTDAAQETELYLERVPQSDIPWGEYYLGLSAVSVALVAVTWAGIVPFANLSGVDVTAILVVVFAVSAIVHKYQSMKNKLGSDRYELQETIG
jgi:predicted house-cleaning noncanonical NTP pyrophosphatase (MazG superfamily)